jgi:hypothetical protein
MRPSIVVALAALAVNPARAADSALDIVNRSLELQDRNFQRSRDYVYQQREVTRESDGSGKVKSTKSETFDVLRLYGRHYMRMIEKDGKPLSEAEDRKEEQRLQKEMEKRRKQSEDPNSKERREFEKERAEFQKLVREISEAFTFQLVGEEQISGKKTWVIQAEPNPNYRPKDMRSGMLAKMHGKLWIAEPEYQWVKVEAETIDTISFGWFLARLSKGSKFRFESRRVNDEVWLPSRADIGIDGRLGLVKKVRAGIEITYSNYRKFQAESKIVSTAPVP